MHIQGTVVLQAGVWSPYPGQSVSPYMAIAGLLKWQATTQLRKPLLMQVSEHLGLAATRTTWMDRQLIQWS